MENVNEKPCYILNIPNELQLMIFDKMEPADKISYGKTSRKCRAIWKESNSLFDGIAWKYSYTLAYKKHVLSFNESYPFVGNGQFVEYFPNYLEFGSNDTNFRQRKECENGFEMAEEKFVKTLEKYQNTVKSITIDGECLATLKNVTSFPNLRYLVFNDAFDIMKEILLKSEDSLEYLKIYRQGYPYCDRAVNFANCPQIYRVSEYLSINVGLTREQLLKLSAKNIRMPMRDLEPEDIFEFIKSWQNGTKGNLESCEWYFYIFNARKFFGFFNIPIINRYKRITIRGIAGTTAEIIFRKRKALEFRVIENAEIIDSDGEGRTDSHMDYRDYLYSSDSSDYDSSSDSDSGETDSE
ncbi:unnamed protein product [Caenorhabditis angaria]|uniref:F-box domain-containing protein n=1 Tax=Caenorhabditis angaria TaxID=860376 RepID=A0A9P1ISP0_9PELO|nr:unnamed protein product [Caenorhabditis angaria]